MRALAGLALLALAACGSGGEQVGSDNTMSPTPAPALQPPARQIGTVSGLSGGTSALKGNVSGFQVRQTATETVAVLAADTLFAFDSATIAPEAEGNLSRTAELVGKGAPGAIRVIGHTDAKGDDAYNDALSRRRAQAVADWLAGPGAITGRQVAVEGRGRREPVAPNTAADGSDDPQGRARNRRVEVIIPRG